MEKSKLCKLFIAALILIGVCFFAPEGNEVQAASKSSTEDYYEQIDIAKYRSGDEYTAPKPTDEKYKDWIFAGWFQKADETSPIGTKTKTGTYYAKFVPSEVLSVKCQVLDGTTVGQETNSKLRIVSTIDSTRYNKVGFDIEVEGQEPISYESAQVAKSIAATADGVNYGYSPNIFDLKSNYFITVTITNIPSESFDTGFCIKPYWITKDNTKVYGVERYTRVEDSYLGIVNIPVRLYSDSTLTAGSATVEYDSTYFTYEDTHSITLAEGGTPITTPGYINGNLYDSIEVTTTEGSTKAQVKCTANTTSASTADGTFVHLRFKKNDNTFKRNEFTVSLADGLDEASIVAPDVIYSHYNSTYTGVADTSWYVNSETEFVITSPDELYGFAKLVNDGKFTTEKVYLGSNITVNKDPIDPMAENWTDGLTPWTPIGTDNSTSSLDFEGKFDGQGHTVSGLYTDKSVNTGRASFSAGFFGTMAAGSEVKNVKVVNSYFKAGDYAGGIVGRQKGGTISNAYSEVHVAMTTTSTHIGAGGIAGACANGTIEKCWFAGSVSGDQYSGGIVGVTNGTSTIQNCLSTGTVHADDQQVGGIVGRIEAQTTLEDCLSTSTVTYNSGGNPGTVIGFHYDGLLKITSVYGYSESGVDKSATDVSGGKSGNVTTDEIDGSAESIGNITTIYGYKALDGEYDLDTHFDFNNTWVVRATDTPVLKSWVEEGALHTPSTAWTGEGTEDNPWIIKTAGELYGLAKSVNEGNTYAGKYFALGANITVNTGAASAWTNNAPAYSWIPIGSTTGFNDFENAFCGNFDGKGYSVRGLYANNNSSSSHGSGKYYLGMFGWAKDATIKDLKLINSNIMGSDRSGGIVGQIKNGTLINLYSDAIVDLSATISGGIVGCINGGAISGCKFEGTVKGSQQVGGIVGSSGAGTTISNSWNAGDVTGSDRYIGGIVGETTESTTIQHCLNEGDIYAGSQQAGGLIGRVQADTILEDSLSVSSVTIVAGNAGSVVGYHNKGNLTVTSVYGYAENAVGVSGGYNGTYVSADVVKANATQMALADLEGEKGYLNTYLGFDRPETPDESEGYWIARNDETPALKSFVADVLDLSGTYRADSRWYTGDAEFYIIDTPEELIGFANLVNNGNNFSGETVKLGADIIVNAGTPEDWVNADTSKLYVWTPIGSTDNNTNYDYAFKGTFDGQEHSVSGLYANNSAAGAFGSGKNCLGMFGWAQGATIENVKLLNSSIIGNHRSGGIVGQIENGTLMNLYTDAQVSMANNMAGGIVGCMNGGTITGCKFEGSVQGALYVGGIAGIVDPATISDCWNAGTVANIGTEIKTNEKVGGILGSTGANSGVSLSNCWNEGRVTGGYQYTGGIIGYIDGSTEITHCFSSGDVSSYDQQVGGLVGHIAANTALRDSLSISKLSINQGIGRNAGSVVAYTLSGTVTIENVYGYAENVGTTTIKTSGGCQLTTDVVKNNATQITDIANITGTNGYLNTWLEFDRPETTDMSEGYWVTTATTPMLKSFADDVLDLSGTYRTDSRWYTEDAESYTIDTAEELIGFANLVNGGKTFASKVVKLGDDIVINAGKAKEWSEGDTSNLYNWIPIGQYKSSNPVFFCGEFNGDGYTISGIYANATTGAALFGQTGVGSKVTNFTMKNSYITGKQGMGAIGGWYCAGTFEKIDVESDVYIEASGDNVGGILGVSGHEGTGTIVRECRFAGNASGSKYVGGIVGYAGGGENEGLTIENTLNAGNVHATNQQVGGIVGRVANSVEVKHCLSTGEVSAYDQQVGGLIGHGAAAITIEDSLSISNLAIEEGINRNAGSIVGHRSAGDATITNAYGYAEKVGTTTIGVSGTSGTDTVKETAVQITDIATITDENAYITTVLNFDDYWVLMKEQIPQLKSFVAEDDENIIDVKAWFDEASSITDSEGTEYVAGTEQNPYVISTKGELYNFAKRVNAGNAFENTYFALGKNITVNEGNPTDGKWAETAPAYSWTPIANETSEISFAGSLDGNGHSISGLYTNLGSTYVGLFGKTGADAEVKDLKLIDSYFANSDTKGAGAIIGQGGGSIDSVYTNATVVVNGRFGGGFIGRIYEAGTEVSNSWFDGTVTVEGAGYYAGGITAWNGAAGTTITNCLSSGNIHVENQQAGGFIGQVECGATLRNCLSLSTVTYNTGGNAGSIYGYHYGDTLAFDNVYGYAENGAGIGDMNTKTNSTATQSGSATKLTDINEVYDVSLAGKLSTEAWTFRVANYPIPSVFATDVTVGDYSEAAVKDAAYVFDTELTQNESGVYQITSPAQLYGFALLSQTNDYANATVALADNITVNNASIDPDDEEAVYYKWLQIGSTDKPFAGTFNGQGNVIKGIYRAGSTYIGLFTATADSSTLTDFRLEDSYFKATSHYIGSIAAIGNGTFEMIYSNAVVVNNDGDDVVGEDGAGNDTGGLIGYIDTDSENNVIDQCWFNGKVETESYVAGGLVSEVKANSSVTIKNSLNSGTVDSAHRRVGGIVGATNGAVTISDSMNTGDIVAQSRNGKDDFGSIVGYVDANGTVDVGTDTTYGVNDFASEGVAYFNLTTDEQGRAPETVLTGTVLMSTKKDRLIGAGLDYDNYWVRRKETTPVLSYFVGDNKVVKEDETVKTIDVHSILEMEYWDNNSISYSAAEDKGVGNYMVTIGSVTKDNYDAYCAALDAGYFNPYNNDSSEELKEQDVYHAIYTSTECGDAANDDWVVSVTYVDGTIYIIFNTGQPLSEHLKAESLPSHSTANNEVNDGYTAAEGEIENTTFHMLQMNYYSASGYIIQLKNGHFIIIDGGMPSETQAKDLIAYLKEHVEEGKKPIVEAWILSHAHEDHAGILQHIANNNSAFGYTDEIYVEGVYFNEAKEAITYTYDNNHHQYISGIKRAAKVFHTTTNGNPEIYRMLTGQRYTFYDVTMDIMLSQELILDSEYASTESSVDDGFNETSTWCMFTIEDQKLLTAGDASEAGKAHVLSMYDKEYLNVDVFMALHHGTNINRTCWFGNQDNFSKNCTVNDIVLYSFGYDRTQPNDTIVAVTGKTAVGEAVANRNSSYISSQTSLKGITVVDENGNQSDNVKYLHYGQGTSILTFHPAEGENEGTITAELLASKYNYDKVEETTE